MTLKNTFSNVIIIGRKIKLIWITNVVAIFAQLYWTTNYSARPRKSLYQCRLFCRRQSWKNNFRAKLSDTLSIREYVGDDRLKFALLYRKRCEFQMSFCVAEYCSLFFSCSCSILIRHRRGFLFNMPSVHNHHWKLSIISW